MDKAQYLTRHFRKDVIEQSTGTYSMVLSLYTKKTKFYYNSCFKGMSYAYGLQE